MLTTNEESCAVAFPRGCNAQRITESGATYDSAPSQRNDLKALAHAALKRNDARNRDATNAQKDAQQMGAKPGCFVARSETDFQPLTDTQLADLITRTANANGIAPLDVWRWMDLSTVEDVRGGDSAVIAAFQADVESAVKSDTLIPDGGHGSPFPGELASTSTPACYPVTCRDCTNQEPTDHPALIRCGAGQPAPGACGMWWATDRHTCLLFAPITTGEAKT